MVKFAALWRNAGLARDAATAPNARLAILGTANEDEDNDEHENEVGYWNTKGHKGTQRDTKGQKRTTFFPLFLVLVDGLGFPCRWQVAG